MATGLRSASIALAALVGAAALAPATSAQANDALAAGLFGGLVGAMLAPSVYPPYGPAYGAPVIVYEYPAYVYPEPYPEPVYGAPAYPVPVYAEPIYAAPPAYGVPAYPVPRHARRPLNEVRGEVRPGPAHAAGTQRKDGPRVITYDDAVGQQIAGAGIEPWTPEWDDYCRSKFRTFEPASGTYMGYDGKRHFCTVK